MRVNVFQVALDASNFYRCQLPAQAAKAAGYDIELVPQGIQPRECDVVVLNRPASFHHVEVIKKLLKDGYKVCVDIDDALGRVPTNHSLFPRAKELDGYIKQACQLATVVTGTTQSIIAEYGFGKGIVIPNYVPRSFLDIKPVNKPKMPIVSWFGSKASHANDLEVTGGGVAKALSAVSGARFGLIGPKHEANEVAKALGIKNGIGGYGWYQDRDLLMQAIATVDVGIVPLEDSLFNQCKSGLKGAEFASVGVPFVCTPTVEYVKLSRMGIGLIAQYPRDWYWIVSKLLKYPEYRVDVAGRAKEAVERHLLIENNVDQWVHAWQLATKCR